MTRAGGGARRKDSGEAGGRGGGKVVHIGLWAKSSLNRRCDCCDQCRIRKASDRVGQGNDRVQVEMISCEPFVDEPPGSSPLRSSRRSSRTR
eukprot:749478-Hanusia_phi.AAC.2